MNKCDSCQSCGMPFESATDHALGNATIPYCQHCTKEDGTLKPFQDVLKGCAEYFIYAQGLDETSAYKSAKELLLNSPAWKSHGEAG